MADIEKQKVLFDEEIKQEVTANKSYQDWILAHRVKLRNLPAPEIKAEKLSGEILLRIQKAYGYTSEELKVILADMAVRATEPIGSMGADTPLAILSKPKSTHCQLFQTAICPSE